ncbi:MAG: glycosyltransferase family 39 protein [Chloroflexota bacterium]
MPPGSQSPLSAARARLWWVLLAFVILSAIYVWSIPPMEGADETEHFAYVAWLAEGRGLPPLGRAAWETPVRQEASQPPLYYALASLPVRLVGTRPPLVFRPNPHFRYELDPTLPDNKNSALHDPADTHPLRGAWLAIYFARGVSVLAGAATVVAVYGLAQTIFPERPAAPLAAALFVASMPQVIFHSSHVSNDMLAAATSAFTLWQLARLARHGPTVGQGMVVGAALGLAALSKVNTLILGLPLLLVIGWLWRQPSTRRSTFLAGLGLAFSFLLVAGWWFGRNWLLYGAPFGLDTHCYQAWASCGPMRLQWPLLTEWWHTFRSFWAAFGLSNVRPPDWLYSLFGLIMLLSLVGLVRAGGRWYGLKRPISQGVILRLALTGAVLGSALLLYGWQQQVLATYGRLLFPALGAFVVLLIDGLWAISPRLAGMVWIAPAMLAWLSPFWLIRPAYALPSFLDPEQIASLGEPIGWRFSDLAELVTVAPRARSAAAGEILPVQVCWRTLSETSENYTMLLHLVGPQDSVVARRYTYPGLGAYPTSVWTPGQVFCDEVRLPIPADLPQTLVYRLEVAWLDEATGERLPAVDAAGRPLAATFASQVRLVASSATRPDLVAEEVAGGGPLRLAAYQTDVTWQVGQSYPVSLTWWVAEPVAADYTVFVHLRDQAGQLVAQADGPPLAGWYPTSWWAAGEVVVDRRVFPVPRELSPGRYELVVGLYDPLSGARLGAEHRLSRIGVIQ